MQKTSRFVALIYAAIIGLIIVAIFLGFLASMTNPISWILMACLFLIPFIYNKTRKSNELKWKPEYSVGVEVLDLDHQKLLTLLNQFNTAYDYATSEEFERQALKELLDYTIYHFDREEKMMADCNYPNLEPHKKQHQDMINEIRKVEAKYNKEGHKALDEVSDFLTNWLINHINHTDKDYTQHMNNNGIK